MKWCFPGQRAPAILDGTAQADIVRALTVCRRIMRRGDDVRQTKKRLAALMLAVPVSPFYSLMRCYSASNFRIVLMPRSRVDYLGKRGHQADD
jgi:hypothetical protein